MNILERVKKNRTAEWTCVLLACSLIAKLVQAFILHVMTDYYPFSLETMLNTAIGMLPSVMLLVYVLVYYKTQMSQLLLPCTFIFQLIVSVLSLWLDYTELGGLDFSLFMGNFCWIAYYVFLFIATYKHFVNPMVVRIVIGVMSLYAMVSSVITWMTLVEVFAEEKAIVVSQAVAIAGYFCYYLATFLIVPKTIEET